MWVPAEDRPEEASDEVKAARFSFMTDLVGMSPDMILQKTAKDEYGRAPWADHCDSNGWTLVHHLAESLNTQRLSPDEYDKLEVESWLWKFRDRGGNIDAFVSKGQKAVGKTALLMLCMFQGRSASAKHEQDVAQLAECLLKMGADSKLCMQGQGRLPMSHAVSHGRWQIVERLIRYGASPHDVDKQGETPHELCIKDTKFGKKYQEWLSNLWDRRPRSQTMQRQSAPIQLRDYDL